MIKAVRSNNPKFKTVTFIEGYNLILADRIQKSTTSKNSRNGAGKTTLIEIIHFCLGAQVRKDSIFKNENLKGWSFILDIDINNEEFSFERFTDNTSRIYVDGNRDIWNIEFKYDKKVHRYFLSQNNFNKSMIELLYGFDPETTALSFRELVSYSIRKGLDGYRNVFEYFPKQKAASVQLCNAYFLNLNLQYAKEFQELREKKTGIENYKKALKAGVTGSRQASIGELNSELITLQKKIELLKGQLDSFKVHPQYEELSSTANNITEKIHDLTNQLVLQESLHERYSKSFIQDEDPAIPVNDIENIYKEAGIYFANAITDTVEDVINFHKVLLANRKEYISSEITSLTHSISEIKATIETLSNERANILKILDEHGALKEYTLLQEQYSAEYQKLEDVKSRLEVAEYVESSKSNLEIENQELLIKTRKDYSERLTFREAAISLFRDNSAALYSEPGVLTIDLDASGYRYDVEIKNSRSQGVNYMKILCYDLVIMELGLQKALYTDFLIHDSTIFDGVDERQIARALQLTMKKAKDLRFQYICLINSDMIPYKEFDEEFKKEFESRVRLRISDEQENGGLLGIRF